MNEQQEKLGAFPFVIGGLSFIPLIGVLFGVIAIAWGLITKKAGGKKLALIGGGGIIFTVVLYSALFYFAFAQRGGVYDDLVFVFDPTDAKIGGEPRYYDYQLVDGEHYYLLGVGPDGQPFTQDDILPKVDVGPQSKVGFLIKPH